MLNLDTVLILVGAAILIAGLYFAVRITRILSREQLSRPWIILSAMITFFFFAYLLIALRSFNMQFMMNVSSDAIVSYVFFGGSVFVLMMTYLNKNVFTNLFGLEMSDKAAVEKFLLHMDIPRSKLNRNILKGFVIKCDHCEREIRYTIPDVVRQHPQLDRGIVLKKGMGTENYMFYIRHQCKDSYREIPVMHDTNFEYRSQSKSRII